MTVVGRWQLDCPWCDFHLLMVPTPPAGPVPKQNVSSFRIFRGHVTEQHPHHGFELALLWFVKDAVAS